MEDHFCSHDELGHEPGGGDHFAAPPEALHGLAGGAGPLTPVQPLPGPEPHVASPLEVALATVAAMTGIRALRETWRRQRDDEAETAPSPGVHAEPTGELRPPVEPAGPAARLASERGALVALCIELDDMLASEALRERLRRGLRRVGVEAVDPIGAAFDAEAHRAVGTAPAPDPAQELVIARVERSGFRDRGDELRPADVIVYRTGGTDA